MDLRVNMDNYKQPATISNEEYPSSESSAEVGPLKKRSISKDTALSKAFSATKELSEYPAKKNRKAEAELTLALRALPPVDNADYSLALARCPELVQSESKPLHFLRREKYDVPSTARRLANYWTRRRSTFGERAFLPLHELSGEGALTAEDVENLSSGLVVKLPDDKWGRTVLCMDRARSESPDLNIKESRLRCLFYWFSMAAQSSKAQTDGVVVLRLLNKANIDRVELQRVLHFARDALPVRISSFHLCCRPPSGAKRTYLQTIIPITTQLFRDEDSGKCHVHVTTSEKDMLPKLEPYGLTKESLPTTLGGTWMYSKLSAWIKQRSKRSAASVSAQEAAMDLSALPIDHVAKKRRKNGKQADGDSVELSKLVEAADIARNRARKERKRQMDAIYARKRRERERSEEDLLQDQCLALSKKNMKLEEENKRFETLVIDASQKIAVIERNRPLAVLPQPQITTRTTSNVSNTSVANLIAALQQQRQQPPVPDPSRVNLQMHFEQHPAPASTQHDSIPPNAMQQALQREIEVRSQLLRLISRDQSQTATDTAALVQSLLAARSKPAPSYPFSTVSPALQVQQQPFSQASHHQTQPTSNASTLLSLLETLKGQGTPSTPQPMPQQQSTVQQLSQLGGGLDHNVLQSLLFSLNSNKPSGGSVQLPPPPPPQSASLQDKLMQLVTLFSSKPSGL